MEESAISLRLGGLIDSGTKKRQAPHEKTFHLGPLDVADVASGMLHQARSHFKPKILEDIWQESRCVTDICTIVGCPFHWFLISGQASHNMRIKVV